MQAVILAGGEGTRLRPLTSRVAKPIVTLVDRPFIAFMLEWLRAPRRHRGRALRAASRRDGVRAELGDGAPLRRAPALRRGARAARHRRRAQATPRSCSSERFLVCNGDILTDIDLRRAARPARPHRRRGDARADRRARTRAPTAWCAPTTTAPCGSSSRSPATPAPASSTSAPAPTSSSAACVELIAAGRAVSLEREIWPALIGNGLYGHHASGYWLDIGTPERYLQGTFDIITGTVRTSSPWEHRSAVIGAGCEIAADARDRRARRAGRRRARRQRRVDRALGRAGAARRSVRAAC